MRHHTATITAFAVAASLALVAAPAEAKPVSTKLASYPNGAQISARGTTVAVAVRSEDRRTATLFVSTGGAAPVVAAGAGPLPRWATPHVGTDGTGRTTVITYPRCSTASVTSCDLYTWNMATQTEHRDAVSRAGVGESEGVYDHGAIAFTRWIGTSTPKTLVDGHPETDRTTLFYKAQHGKVRQSLAPGGRQLMLIGARIAQVRDITRPSDGGVCGTSAVEFVTLSGRVTRPIKRETCGLNGQVLVAPTIVGEDVFFGSASNNAGRGMVFRRDVDVSHGATLQGSTPRPFAQLAVTSRHSAFVLVNDGPSGDDLKDSFELDRIDDLAITSTKAP